MKRFLVAAMALAMLAGSATAALADPPAGTVMGPNQCASNAGGTNLGQTATAASATSITVEWRDYCDGEDAFRVHRSATSGGTYAVVGTVAGGSDGAILSYLDTGLDCGTTYYYKVEAIKYPNARGNGGQSSMSVEFSGTTGACAVEGKPAQAIANAYLNAPGSPAALQCASVLGSSWHGDVLSAAHVKFGTRKFAPNEEVEVTTWIDDEICAS